MIEAIPSITTIQPNVEIDPARQSSGPDFAQMIGGGLKGLSTDLNASDEVLRSLAAGQNIPLHDVMIMMSRAQLDLQFAVQVRNRLVESYQQLSQMQV